MASTQEQVEKFYRFATEQLANGGSGKSIDELYDQWRFESVSAEELAENVTAIQASIRDMNLGDSGRDATGIIQEMRQELSGPDSQ